MIMHHRKSRPRIQKRPTTTITYLRERFQNNNWRKWFGSVNMFAPFSFRVPKFTEGTRILLETFCQILAPKTANFKHIPFLVTQAAHPSSSRSENFAGCANNAATAIAFIAIDYEAAAGWSQSEVVKFRHTQSTRILVQIKISFCFSRSLKSLDLRFQWTERHDGQQSPVKTFFLIVTNITTQNTHERVKSIGRKFRKVKREDENSR